MNNPMTLRTLLLLGFFVFSGSIAPKSVLADEDDPTKSSVEAPANMREVAKTLGGAYFADKSLVQQSKSLKSQLNAVRSQILSGEINSVDAMNKLESIESKLQLVRESIEQQKVLVSAFNVYTKTSEEIFPLGDEKLVIVTADKIQIRSWEGPGIKCVLKKSILAKEQPDEKAFAQIQIKHKHDSAEDLVGQTREESELQEREFLASEDGKKLTDQHLASRRAFVEEIISSKDKYVPFQGKKCNMLSLKGLLAKEGNTNLSMEVSSPGGGSFHSSIWQRHASLTVFLPDCKWLAVRGGEVGVDIEGIQTNLLLTTVGSRDRDYEGSFEIADVDGDIKIFQVPIRRLVGIRGNVDFIATNEFVNSGTLHTGGTRTARSYDTKTTEIRDVSGNLDAWFLRTNLSLNEITGTVNVQNEYGNTTLVLDEKFDSGKSHRIVSESGNVEVGGAKELLIRLPIYGYTLSGTVHTNLRREVLDDVSFSTGQPNRGWSGFVTPSKERFSPSKFERPANVLANKTRAAGLDLISKNGTVNILAGKNIRP